MRNRSKVLMVFGTRPEAIKMAPLYHALKARADRFETIVCVTAQHREMLDQAMKVFDIEPDIDLNLMKAGQDLYDVTTSVLTAMRDVLREQKPDSLLVHGDTTTTLSSAIAGYYSGVRVGHVEAGLRTHDIYAPYPEEFNRQVASKVTRWHFAPTSTSRKNLLAEGIPSDHITITGNTVIDALHWVLARIDADADLKVELSATLDRRLPFAWQEERFILVTGHRRENFGDGFVQICEALRGIANRYPTINLVYPVHLNPNVRRPVNQILANLPNVHLIEPLDYQPFVQLLRHSHIVLTDSGGIQEEAPSLGKPVLVMRDVTERPEAVEAGTVKLVGANKDRIVQSIAELLDNPAAYAGMAQASNPYGDGKACERIVDVLSAAREAALN